MINHFLKGCLFLNTMLVYGIVDPTAYKEIFPSEHNKNKRVTWLDLGFTEMSNFSVTGEQILQNHFKISTTISLSLNKFPVIFS